MMLPVTLKTLAYAGTVTLMLGMGAAHAQADKITGEIPATRHQTEVLNLRKEISSSETPEFQESRQAADYVAVMPVTQHQVELLQLRDVGTGVVVGKDQPS